LFPDYALCPTPGVGFTLMIKHTVRITTFARDVGIQQEHHLSEAMRGGKGRKSCKGWKGGYIDAAKNYWTAPAKPDEAWSKGFMSEQVAQKILLAGSAARQRFDALITIYPTGVPLTADTLSGGMIFQLPVSQSMVPSDKSIDVVKYTPWLWKRVVVLTGKYTGRGATVTALCKMKIKLRVDGVEHELEYYPDKIQPPTDLDEIAASAQMVGVEMAGIEMAGVEMADLSFGVGNCEGSTAQILRRVSSGNYGGLPFDTDVSFVPSFDSKPQHAKVASQCASAVANTVSEIIQAGRLGGDRDAEDIAQSLVNQGFSVDQIERATRMAFKAEEEHLSNPVELRAATDFYAAIGRMMQQMLRSRIEGIEALVPEFASRKRQVSASAEEGRERVLQRVHRSISGRGSGTMDEDEMRRLSGDVLEVLDRIISEEAALGLDIESFQRRVSDQTLDAVQRRLSSGHEDLEMLNMSEDLWTALMSDESSFDFQDMLLPEAHELPDDAMDVQMSFGQPNWNSAAAEEGQKQVHSVVDEVFDEDDNTTQYLVRWVGRSEDETEWVPAEVLRNLKGGEDKLAQYKVDKKVKDLLRWIPGLTEDEATQAAHLSVAEVLAHIDQAGGFERWREDLKMAAYFED